MNSKILIIALMLVAAGVAQAAEAASLDQIHATFTEPPMDCRPHTRWWWLGNALTKQDITFQIDQMYRHGIGGVEQITMDPVYEKGNAEYASPQYFDLLRHAIEQARDKKMEVALNFGGPFWIWGGKWVPREDQSKVMLSSMLLLEGPRAFSGRLSEDATINPRDVPRSTPIIGPEDRLIKVVAGKVEDGRLRRDSLVDLTALANGREISWDVPEGRWQLMAFWITQRENSDAVDHMNEGAMQRYCETLGQKYVDAIGEHLGKTVDSFFSDSFEVPIYRNGLYWTDNLFERFEKDKGYDLVPLLPAIWWEVDDVSSKVRYDVNEFLHEQGMRAFFGSFLNWCERHNVKGRIQPYGFATDNIEGAAVSHIPEAEITAGEKDAVPWFDTRIGPKQYVASGAHLAGTNVISAEAFTFLHWEPYRANLEELKIATDGYFVTGINKLYNHGYVASPERDIVPARSFYEAIRISHENVWWPYYRHLADYTARGCWLMRQGRPVVDVAVYSPLANQWAISAINPRKWTREFDWANLGELLLANGYSFDLVNDKMLQSNTRMDGQQLHVGAMTYQVLILPDVATLPAETYRQVLKYVEQGGAVIALEQLPQFSTGLNNYAENDAEVARISSDLFRQPTWRDDTGLKTRGKGRAYFMKTVMRRQDQLDWRSAPLDPFLKVLGECVQPDLDLGLVAANLRNNQGLAFFHRRTDDADIYFLSNMQYAPLDLNVGFKTSGHPELWDPQTGTRSTVASFARDDDYTRMQLAMDPFESRILVFNRTQEQPHIARSDFASVTRADGEGFTALAARNGVHTFDFVAGGETKSGSLMVEHLPAPFEVNGAWKVRFPDDRQFEWSRLISWTDIDEMRHFSGKARYRIDFDLPDQYVASDTQLRLDLGAVGTIAEVWLNGQPLGVRWMRGQRFNVDGIVRPGANTLEIDVVNTLINRVAGLKRFPDVPDPLQERLGCWDKPDPLRVEILKGFEPLPPSGLIGPVTLTPLKRVEIAASAIEK